MRIALLSGADKNAGDFLIVHRSRQLLEAVLGDVELVELKRNEPLGEKLGVVNACDCVVFAGGPGYVPDMYPGRFPLAPDLGDIRPPMFALGMGGWMPGRDASAARFDEGSRKLLARLEADGFGLGCRDVVTRDMLLSAGYASAVFTGCPAWHDPGKAEIGDLLEAPREIGRICVSDAAALRNVDAPRALVEALGKAFPAAEVALVFHRGWRADAFSGRAVARRQARLAEWARENGVEAVDISYSHEGFGVYDRCDLHVGFRVHAHLYNISQRKPSFLIEEDVRGWGANDSLGLGHVSLWSGPRVAGKAGGALARIGWPPWGARREAAAAEAMVRRVEEEVEAGYPRERAACGRASAAYGSMLEHLGGLRRLAGAGGAPSDAGQGGAPCRA